MLLNRLGWAGTWYAVTPLDLWTSGCTWTGLRPYTKCCIWTSIRNDQVCSTYFHCAILFSVAVPLSSGMEYVCRICYSAGQHCHRAGLFIYLFLFCSQMSFSCLYPQLWALLVQALFYSSSSQRLIKCLSTIGMVNHLKFYCRLISFSLHCLCAWHLWQ